MEITREMRIGMGALAFVGAIVLMLPPTTPVAPVAIAVRSHARTTASPPVDAPGLASYSATTAAPASGASPLNSAPPVAEPYVEWAARDLASIPSPQWRDSAPVSADDGEQAGVDPDFTMGYRWAEQNIVTERHDCRRWRGSPAEEGCRAYLRDADDENSAADARM